MLEICDLPSAIFRTDKGWKEEGLSPKIRVELDEAIRVQVLGEVDIRNDLFSFFFFCLSLFDTQCTRMCISCAFHLFLSRAQKSLLTPTFR
jgi:hypothetical protein